MAEEAEAAPVPADDTAAPAPEAVNSEPQDEIAFQTEAKEQQPQNMVPSWRLRQEADKRRQLEARIQGMLNNTQNNPEDAVRARFGAEEEGGREAYEAVRGVAQMVTEQEKERLRAELRAEMQAEIHGQVGAVTATMQTAQTLANMKASGKLDDAGEKLLGQRMAAIIQEDPRWGTAENQPHLLNQEYMKALLADEIRPARRARSATPSNGMNPLQAGGAGSVSKSEQQLEREHDELLLDAAKRNRRTAGLTIEQLREMMPRPTGPLPAGQNGEMTFVHRRGA